MAFLTRQGSKVDYNYKEFYCDNIADLNNIDTSTCAPGSVAYIVNSGQVYMLNNKKEWVAQ